MKSRVIVDHAAAYRAAIVGTIWVPAAIVVASEIVVIAAGAAAPAGRLITHWGPGGVRTGPWWTYAILVVAVGIPVIAIMGFFMLRATRMAGRNAWMPAVAVAVTVFHCLGLGVGPVVLNTSPLAPALPLIGGAVLGIASGLLTWRLLPGEEPAAAPVDLADELPVKQGEIAIWTGRAELPPAFIAVVTSVAALLVALGVALMFITGRPHFWPLFVVPLILLSVLALTGEFTVTAGPVGFSARSALGWPRLTIPAADLAGARVIQVDPIADFGGWGVRVVVGPQGKSRRGIIMRRGPAVEVLRHDGRSVVVTVEDAGTAAAVLETYARSRA